MSQKKVIVKTPGKLFIAGEYAILERNHEAIVIAVNRYVTVTIEESDENELILPQLGFPKVTWTGEGQQIKYSVEDKRLHFIQNTIGVIRDYVQKPLQPFRMTVLSELDDPSGRKYGLGSSAAISVGVVTAMLSFFGEGKPEEETIFKLASIAHFKTQGNGSGADIAASTFGGWLGYTAFQGVWLQEHIENRTPVLELVHKNWPSLSFRRLTPPADLHLCIGWTKSEAKTGPMVENVQQLKVKNPPVYKDFLKKSADALSTIIESFEQNDVDQAILGLAHNRKALSKLNEFTEVAIETHKLQKLIEIANQYGSGKSSGAGGGDCGIAFVKGKEASKLLKGEWERVHIPTLDLKVSENGATVM